MVLGFVDIFLGKYTLRAIIKFNNLDIYIQTSKIVIQMDINKVGQTLERVVII